MRCNEMRSNGGEGGRKSWKGLNKKKNEKM
jgi:hypothetical protein